MWLYVGCNAATWLWSTIRRVNHSTCAVGHVGFFMQHSFEPYSNYVHCLVLVENPNCQRCIMVNRKRDKL